MRHFFLVLGFAYGLAIVSPVQAQPPAAGDGPRYKGPELIRPEYREWVFLSAGLDMIYPQANEVGQLPPRHSFTNVFVNPSSYRTFLQTGKWKDGTVLVMEARASDGVPSRRRRVDTRHARTATGAGRGRVVSSTPR